MTLHGNQECTLVTSGPGIQEVRWSDWERGKPVVSVVVQTYEHGPFIAECLESIVAQQTDFPFEVLVGEDDSRDGTRETCLEYARRFPDLIRLVLHDRSNLIRVHGVPTGRFNMLTNFRRARGKYLAFCEGDDYWADPRKLQRQVEFMETHSQFGISFHNAKKVDEQGRVLVERMLPPAVCRDRTPREMVASHTPMPTPTVLLRRELVASLPPQFERVMAADLFLFSYLAQFGGAGYVEIEPSAYRIHAGGIFSRQKPSARIFYVLHTYRELLDVLPADLRGIAGFRLCEKYHQLIAAQLRERHWLQASGTLGKYLRDAVLRIGWRTPLFQLRLGLGGLRRWLGARQASSSNRFATP